MLWIDRIHRWTGALIGLLLAALGLTGTLLLYEDAWLRATVLHADQPRVEDIATLGGAAERLLAEAPSAPGGIIFPTDSVGLFKLSFNGGAGAYADQSGAIVEQWASKWQRPELWLSDFHQHLLMGELGETVGGSMALIGLGFVITGLILWWRTRKTFALRLLPARFTRLQIARHHRDLGVVMAPMLFVSLLTGAMLTLRPVADFVLAPLSSPGTIAASLASPTVVGGPLTPAFDWEAAFRTINAAYPDAELRSIGLPKRAGELVRIRARQPAEWLPNGRTVFWFDAATGRLVEKRDAMTLPLATRAFNLVYPLHVARVGGVVYQVVMTATGLALTLLGTLAVIGFWRYQIRQSARSGAPLSHTVPHETAR